ncbi:amidohydrolase family protein [uncultured Amnibacterium sp.]|uniref:amidohydrolase family protein n=1 Tax=uncultured Amnibacterium sp. TaxID=1631851 RepID=UPI0035CAC920
MTRFTVHRAGVVLPVTAPPIAGGAVAVADGLVVAVGRFDDVLAELPGGDRRVVEWRGAIVPGLVNAHTHLQYTGMAEVGRGAYRGFEDWAGTFNAVYRTIDDWAASAAAGARAALASGTTAAADVVTDVTAGAALHDAGLKGIAYWEVFGWTRSRWEAGGRAETLDRVADLPAAPGAGLSPHAVYSVDRGVLVDIARLARDRGLRQHIHAAESASEDEYVRTGSGPLADRWRDLGHSDLEVLRSDGVGLPVLPYLDSTGSLSPRTHLAHGVYVSAADRALLRERGVTVALCPRSNAVIGLAPPPVADYLVEGNRIAVGTDSLGSSASLDPLDDVAALVRIAREQGYRAPDLHARLLAAATHGGARALGLDEGAARIGVLEPRAAADLAVLAIDSTTAADALVEIVEGGGGRGVATMIDGSIVWQRPGDRSRSEVRGE